MLGTYRNECKIVSLIWPSIFNGWYKERRGIKETPMVLKRGLIDYMLRMLISKTKAWSIGKY